MRSRNFTVTRGGKRGRPARRRGRGAAVKVVSLMVSLFLLVMVFRGDDGSRAENTVGGDESGVGLASEARHAILDRNYSELAGSFALSALYARPLEISSPVELVRELTKIVGVDENKLRQDLKAERSFVWLARNLSREKAIGFMERLKARGLSGVYLVDEFSRYYPRGKDLAPLIGFSRDGQGLAGIEAKYDSLLQQRAEYPVPAAGGGGPLVLTLDLALQDDLAELLSGLMARTGAIRGMGVLMDPENGEVLALVNLPGYDPNFFWKFAEEERAERVMDEPFLVAGLNILHQIAGHFDRRFKEGALTSVAKLKFDLQLAGEMKAGPRRPWFHPGAAGNLVSRELFPDEFTGGGAGGYPDRVPRKTTILAILSEFVQMLRKGEPLAPHLLLGAMNPATGEVADLSREVSGKQVPLRSFNPWLAGWLGRFSADRDPVIVEVMEDSVQVELRELRDGLLAAAGSRGRDLVPGRGKVEGRGNYRALLLGVSPKKNPKIALALALEQADLGGRGKSPLRVAAERELAAVLKDLPMRTSSADLRLIRQNHQKIYRQWLAGLVSADGRKQGGMAGPGSTPAMPALMGGSLRQALRKIQPLGLAVSISGYGRVVAQQPEPGQIPAASCRLILAGDLTGVDDHGN